MALVGKGYYALVFADGEKAWKTPHPDSLEEAERAFAMEVHALRAVGHHPNVVRLLAVAPLCVTLELLDVALAAVPLTLDHLRQCLAGLAHVHSCDFVHHDVNPDNFMVRRGVVKLIDFNCATEVGNPLLGYEIPVTYSPPEWWLGRYEGAKSYDLWGMGCTWYELATRKKLVEGPSGSARERVRSTRSLVETLTSPLLRSMLSDVPSKRPSAAEAVTGLLAALLEEE